MSRMWPLVLILVTFSCKLTSRSETSSQTQQSSVLPKQAESAARELACIDANGAPSAEFKSGYYEAFTDGTEDFLHHKIAGHAPKKNDSTTQAALPLTLENKCYLAGVLVGFQEYVLQSNSTSDEDARFSGRAAAKVYCASRAINALGITFPDANASGRSSATGDAVKCKRSFDAERDTFLNCPSAPAADQAVRRFCGE